MSASLRDQIAIAALAALGPRTWMTHEYPELVRCAYAIADAMLEERGPAATCRAILESDGTVTAYLCREDGSMKRLGPEGPLADAIDLAVQVERGRCIDWITAFVRDDQMKATTLLAGIRDGSRAP